MFQRFWLVGTFVLVVVQNTYSMPMESINPQTSSTTLPPLQTPIRWGIIGVGDVCEVKSGPAFYKCTDSSLGVVMRRTADKAKDFAERHNVPRYYSSIDDVLEDDGIDAIYVATPPGGDRLKIAQAVVKAGKPCYMEKPLGRDGNEAQEIANLFTQAKLPLYTAYYRRSMSKFIECHRIMHNGTLGQLTSVTCTLHLPFLEEDKSIWRYDKSMSGGGILMDMGCHMLDLVDHFLGPLQNCVGVAARTVSNQGWVHDKEQGVEDNVRGHWIHRVTPKKEGEEYTLLGSCSFEFCGGGPAVDQIQITGTKGVLRFSCFDPGNPELLIRRGEKVEKQIIETEWPAHVHQPMVQDIVDELKSGTYMGPGSRLCSGTDAVRTSVVIDKLLNNRKSWTDDYLR
mmetsp:Transcript_19774/g.30521  ORF Transcript_19774/g.30521 Transcript_19774/m.30521 type:complete len:397 (-) Transcript_19774:1917-3107(-)